MQRRRSFERCVTLLDRELPAFVRDLLGSAPKVGEGVNTWLFRTARVLHPFRRESEIVALLQAATYGQRIRAEEIERAVRNSKAAAWNPSEPVTAGGARASTWPVPDAGRRGKIIAEGPDAASLCELSPVGFDMDDGSDADEIVEQLFSTASVPDPLLCVGKTNWKFATRPLSRWIHKGQAGRKSAYCSVTDAGTDWHDQGGQN